MKQTLSQALEQINQIPFINAGGCGHVAQHLYEYITNHFPTQPIQILYGFVSDFHEEYEQTHIENGTPESADHVMIKLRSYYIDSRGLHTYDQMDELYDTRYEVSYSYLKDSLEMAFWNSSFNKSNIELIPQYLYGEIPCQSNLFSIS